mgnify:CR=1 FL=1
MTKGLILGGARFHGYLLAKYFSEKGDEVYVLNRGNFRNNYPLKIKQIIADRNNSQQLKNALEGFKFDYVIDNNAYTPMQIEIFLNIMKDRIRHYVFTSTASVYLNFFSDKSLKENESDGIKKGFISPDIENYGTNKYLSEMKIKEYDINYTILRLPNIFGEGDFAGKLTYFNERFKDKRKVLVEQESNFFSLVYAGDLPEIYDLVLKDEKCFNKVINIADPEPCDYDSFFSSISNDYSKKNLLFLSAEKIFELGYSKSFYMGPIVDVSLAKELLNPVFTPINIWGKRTLEWEKNNLNENKKQEHKIKRIEELKSIEKLK